MYNAATDTGDISLLPKPVGYKVLVAMPEVKDKSSGGVFLPDNLKTQEQTASIVARVVSLGPDAYLDKEKFPSGPLCAPGDWVVFRSYNGTRFKHIDREYRLINDDTVEATISNPELYKRV